jgi:hypothetical protein
MAAIAFDTLAYVRRIVAAGVPREQAEAQADAMKEAFVHNVNALVTRDYLDTRFTEFETRVEANMDRRFSAMEASVAERFSAMEASVAERFSSVDQRFSSVDQQFLGLESRMDVQFAAINTELRWLKWLIVTGIAATVWPSLSGLIQ